MKDEEHEVSYELQVTCCAFRVHLFTCLLVSVCSFRLYFNAFFISR